MTAEDKLLNYLLKAVEEYNKQHDQKITPLQALKMFCSMNR